MKSYSGRCHCGAIGFTYSTDVGALSPIPAGVAEPRAMTYEGEDAGERSARRAQRWSPAQDAMF